MPTGKKSDTLRIRLFSWIPVSSLYSKFLHVSFPVSSFSNSQLRRYTQLLFDDYNILLSIFKVFFCLRSSPAPLRYYAWAEPKSRPQ